MLVTSDPEFFLQGWFLFPSCPPHGSDPPCGPGSLPAQGQSFWPPPSLLPPHTSVQKKRASLGGPLSLNSDTHQNREPQAATPGLTRGAALLSTQPAPHSQTHPGGGPALHAACSPSPGAAPSQGRGGGLFGPPPLASSGVGAQTRHLGPVPSGPWSPRVLHLWGPVSGTTWQTAHKTSPPGGRGDDKRGVGAIPWLSATQLAPLGDVLAK